MYHRNDAYYEVAQVCLNGHVITGHYNSSPEFRKPYCNKCGSATIHKCPNCEENIQGDYIVFGVPPISSKKHAPVYCSNCGQPFPWTESRLQAARELAEEMEDLYKNEELVESLPDLISDNPRTTVAATKWKKALSQVGRYTAEAFREILVDIVSESAKKILFP